MKYIDITKLETPDGRHIVVPLQDDDIISLSSGGIFRLVLDDYQVECTPPNPGESSSSPGR